MVQKINIHSTFGGKLINKLLNTRVPVKCILISMNEDNKSIFRQHGNHSLHFHVIVSFIAYRKRFDLFEMNFLTIFYTQIIFVVNA